ncbi:MAG: HD domain-containing protein [Blautia sp.]|nr:HD domain-containing protein [Blautia sp.]
MTEMFQKGKMNKIDEKDICSTILKYGENVLSSDIFQQSSAQTHHVLGTVFDHTINVCAVSLWLARQLKERGVAVNEKDLVQAALCHDLGMIGRDSKYKDTLDSWKDHPKESARIARELIPDLSSEAEDMILSHMWPLSGPAPRSNEGMLLCISDKYASMADWKSWLTEHRLSARIREFLNDKVDFRRLQRIPAEGSISVGNLEISWERKRPEMTSRDGKAEEKK